MMVNLRIMKTNAHYTNKLFIVKALCYRLNFEGIDRARTMTVRELSKPDSAG